MKFADSTGSYNTGYNCHEGTVSTPPRPTISGTAARDQPTRRRRRCKCRCPAALTALLLCLLFAIAVAITFIVCFAVYYTRYINSTGSSTNASYATTLCLTEDCVKAAAFILKNANFSVDPCENFDEYSCGNWKRSHSIHLDWPAYSTFDEMSEELDIRIKDVLGNRTQDNSNNVNTVTTKIKQFYESCMNTKVVDGRNASAFLTEFGEWPVINDDNHTVVNLEDLIASQLMKGNPALFDIKITAIPTATSDTMIMFLQPPESVITVDNSTDGERLNAYTKLITEVAQKLADDAYGHIVNADQIQKMIAFEKELSTILMSRSDLLMNISKYYEPIDWHVICSSVKTLDMRRIAMGTVEKYKNLPDKLAIGVMPKDYILISINDLVNRTENRTLASFIFWQAIKPHIKEYLSWPHDIGNCPRHELWQYADCEPRWKTCVRTINKLLDRGVGRVYYDAYRSDADMTAITSMSSELHGGLESLFIEADWMDTRSRAAAIDKANFIVANIMYPKYITEDAELISDYQNLTIDPQTYFENIINAKMFNVDLMMRQANNSWIDKERWSTTLFSDMSLPLVNNDFYNPQTNRINIPAGGVLAPTYRRNVPKYVNYAALGTIIGHELTHAFDLLGTKFDRYGNFISNGSWMDAETLHKFVDKIKEMMMQYQQFTVDGRHLDPVTTISEIVADNGGMRLAYKIYKNLTESAPSSEQLQKLSRDQLFFLSYGQLYCEIVNPEKVALLLADEHPPKRIRMTGVLWNSEEFAKAFNCPKDSYMNPSHKTRVW